MVRLLFYLELYADKCYNKFVLDWGVYALDKICFFHYNNAIDAMNKGSVVAINSVWLFIKNLLVAAYGEKYSDEASVNVDLINMNISDRKLRSALHEIRTERNNYEHENLITCTLETIERWRSTLQDCIKYVNSTTTTGYKFKLKDIDTINARPIDEVIGKDDKIILDNQNQEIQYFIKKEEQV